MQAYVILAGGVVKGAALAGALKAAAEAGVRALGYGGTSAGSIVSLLAAARYEADELEELMIRGLRFSELLDPVAGVALRSWRRRLKRFESAFQSGSTLRRGIEILGLCGRAAWDFRNRLGLDRGEVLRRTLSRLVRAKLDGLESDVFDLNDFEKAGGLPLRVVATDLRGRGPVEQHVPPPRGVAERDPFGRPSRRARGIPSTCSVTPPGR